MDEASTVPEADLESETPGEVPDERLEVFKDFMNSLDIDDLEANDSEENDG